MTLEELYAQLKGNYQDALSRLMNERIMGKFVLKFPGDPSFSLLDSNLRSGNKEEAFRASHSLKGVARNLGFTKLGDSASEICEVLRPGNESLYEKADLKELFRIVKEDYDLVISSIEEYKVSNQL